MSSERDGQFDLYDRRLYIYIPITKTFFIII